MQEQVDIRTILSKCDHTLLSPTATWQDIRTLCQEGMEFGVASVCIPPCYVSEASAYVQGAVPICTVIGFPHGNATIEAKVFEAQDALAKGADEVDMVINIGQLKAGEQEYVLSEIRAIKEACGQHVLKVIVEACLLTEEEKAVVCSIVNQSGADYIKTSTGFSSGGATFEDVALFAKMARNGVKVKAAGGIATLRDAQRFIDLGASRLGTSHMVKLAQQQRLA